MKIIDFHTHIYPEKIAAKATQSVAQEYDLHAELTGTANVLLSEGKEAGISKYVLLPVAVTPEHIASINNFVSQQTKEHSEFIGFGTLHAAMENPLEEIGRLQTLGLCGIKFHPDMQRFPIDDSRLDVVYDALQGRLPVLIHCGDPRYDYSHPKRLKNVLRKFPKLTVIAAHMGGWGLIDTAYEVLKNENCYFDISSTMMFVPRDRLVNYIRLYGVERILFGTDFPLWNPSKEVESLLNLGLTSDETESIAGINAERLLNSTK